MHNFGLHPLPDQINSVSIFFSDPPPQRDNGILEWSLILFEDIDNCSAWLRLKLNTKIGLHTHHPPPAPHKLLGSYISAVTGPILIKL